MADKFTRRAAIAMSVAAPTVGLAAPHGGELDQSMVGVNIKIAWRTGWHVWLPDFEAMAPSPNKYWYPGMAVPGKWVPLQEYLGVMEAEYKLVPRAA